MFSLMIYFLKGRVAVRGGGKRTLLAVVHSPQASSCWAGKKPEARDSAWVTEWQGPKRWRRYCSLGLSACLGRKLVSGVAPGFQPRCLHEVQASLTLSWLLHHMSALSKNLLLLKQTVLHDRSLQVMLIQSVSESHYCVRIPKQDQNVHLVLHVKQTLGLLRICSVNSGQPMHF